MNILSLKKLLNLLDNDTLISTADHVAISKIKNYLKRLDDENEEYVTQHSAIPIKFSSFIRSQYCFER
ncbi:hypothetical protein [Legionella parisiensis]|uniref:Uncharacterized protein n=1 Tax=Legionella parisiensis TaxID=45071 RepID=A0A1E5JWL1_9GAMM|nr:hypothetical protein [Legionella parisiensis]KTD42232.1 hypothetical protein Lpar_3549 [Legionella parisiensis]OEH48902.1 hypothetical protein lpari_00047 [Legionella parisiensis]STX72299.1 Uncharacterised protein [Legionella parisiensis]